MAENSWMVGTRPAMTRIFVDALLVLGGDARLGERYELAAATRACLVRIVEHEARGHAVAAVIHLGAEQEQHGSRIDEDAHALVLDHLIMRRLRLGIAHGVFHAGATALLHADAEAGGVLA